MLDRSYRKLPAGRVVMRLIEAIYRLTEDFPDDERPVLTATIKKTAALLPSQLATGHAQSDPVESADTLTTALVTLRELTTYLDVAEHLRMASRRRFRTCRRFARKLARHLLKMLAKRLAENREELPQVAWAW